MKRLNVPVKQAQQYIDGNNVGINC